MRRSVRVVVAVAAVAVTGCASAGGQPTAPGVATATSAPSASATATPTPCGPAPATHAPIPATQALSLIPVHVLTGVPASSAVMDLGTAACVNVGVHQRVSLRVRARIPPPPVEMPPTPRLLSPITITPAVPSSFAAPRPGVYILTFTAESAGSTAIMYLAATCTLAPGAC